MYLHAYNLQNLKKKKKKKAHIQHIKQIKMWQGPCPNVAILWKKKKKSF